MRDFVGSIPASPTTGPAEAAAQLPARSSESRPYSRGLDHRVTHQLPELPDPSVALRRQTGLGPTRHHHTPLNRGVPSYLSCGANGRNRSHSDHVERTIEGRRENPRLQWRYRRVGATNGPPTATSSSEKTGSATLTPNASSPAPGPRSSGDAGKAASPTTPIDTAHYGNSAPVLDVGLLGWNDPWRPRPTVAHPKHSIPHRWVPSSAHHS